MTSRPMILFKKEKQSTNKYSVESSAGTSNIPSIVKGSVDLGRSPELKSKYLRLGRATFNKYVFADPNFGEKLFKELFYVYPNYHQFFIGIFGTPNKDLFTNKNFINHMNVRVITKLRDIVDNLDNQEELKDIMTKLGLYHVKVGVRRIHMEQMQSTIIRTIRLAMDRTMQEDEEIALHDCLSSAFTICIAAMEEYLEKEKQVTAQQVSKNLTRSQSEKYS